MRILLVGDLHANTGAAFQALDHAAEVGADLVLQVGDYGWWPRDPGGQKFILKVEKRLAEHGLDLWWIDGNHSDFDRLDAHPIDEDGRRQLSDHVWHLPRGFRCQSPVPSGSFSRDGMSVKNSGMSFIWFCAHGTAIATTSLSK